MESNIVFYIYDKFIELNGRQFSAGELTADFLNLSPEVYRPMHERMARICKFEVSFSESKDLAQWWELNTEMDALCNELRRYTVFQLLLGEDEDRFFSVVREITGQFDLFPMAERETTSEEQLRAIQAAAEKFFQLNEVDPVPEQDIPWEPFDLFHPRAADKEKSDDFFYAIYCTLGPTKGAWEQYREHIARYRTYLHDIRAFNGTIRNFIKFGLSQLKHTHFYGIDDLTGYYDDVDAYDYLLEDESTAPPKQVIYHRIRMEYFKELFDALPRRDKDILGKYYGVFGHRKEPLADIGMYHLLSERGVRDAKDKALEKLRKAYPTSMMRYWSKINRALEYPDRLFDSSEYD